VGNDNYLASVKGQFVANFPPDGMSLTPPRFTGRFSDGQMFGDFLGEGMGKERKGNERAHGLESDVWGLTTVVEGREGRKRGEDGGGRPRVRCLMAPG